MRFHVGDINHLCIGRSPPRGKFAKQSLPHPALRPAYKTIVNRRRRPVFRRTIAPPAAALDHVHDAANHSAVIDAGYSQGSLTGGDEPE